MTKLIFCPATQSFLLIKSMGTTLSTLFAATVNTSTVVAFYVMYDKYVIRF